MYGSSEHAFKCLPGVIQDSEFQLKRGRVTITQWVPNNKWFMVPSPAIKVRIMYLPFLSLCAPGACITSFAMPAASEIEPQPHVEGIMHCT